MKKKIFSVLLSLMMCLMLIPTNVLAEEDEGSSKTLTVGASETYTTIQQAINAIYAEEDPTGWTIEVESGTYLQFAIPKELDGLTVKAAEGADVTITAWTGEYDNALTAAPNSTKSSNSYYNTQGYCYVFNSVFVQAESVTFSGLNFTLGTASGWKYWDGESYNDKGNKIYSNYTTSVDQPEAEVGEWESDGWYRACITDLGGYANGKTMSTGMTVTNCTFSSEKQGYVTTYPTGSTYNAYGILIGASTSWTVTDCNFSNFSSAICFMCDNYYVSSDGITVTGNTFTSCDRAMDGYYGGTPDGTAGTLTFADNAVTGTSALRSKVVVMDQASKGSIGAVSVTGNTFTYTMVLMENMAESSCTVNDILEDNTFATSSYYVEGDGWYYSGSYHGSIIVNLPDAAYYESPADDMGYWVLNVDLDSIGSNSEGATAYVQAIVDAANASGSHTLNITWADTDEATLLYTVTAFKDCIYWVSGEMPTEKVSEPGLDKVIVTTDDEGNEVEVDQDEVAAGDDVSYKLTSNVPSNLDDYIDYSAAEGSTTTNVIPLGTVGTDNDNNTYKYILTFHDVLDSTLIFNNDVAVTLVTYELDDNGYVTTTVKDTIDVKDYANITVSTDNAALADDCTFEVSIDLLELYAEGKIVEADFGSAQIVVTYTATLSETATAGAYYNTAWVVYPGGNSEEDKVEVDTYDLSIYKYDQSVSDGVTYTKGLPGAEFRLLQIVENAEDADDTVEIDGVECYVAVVKTVTSGENGIATISGLDAGTYYLQETEAPTGYVASGTVLEVEVSAENANNYVVTVQFANAPVPSTGGMGTTLFTIVGMCLLLAAGAVYVFTRRRFRNA